MGLGVWQRQWNVIQEVISVMQEAQKKEHKWCLWLGSKSKRQQQALSNEQWHKASYHWATQLREWIYVCQDDRDICASASDSNNQQSCFESHICSSDTEYSMCFDFNNTTTFPIPSLDLHMTHWTPREKKSTCYKTHHRSKEAGPSNVQFTCRHHCPPMHCHFHSNKQAPTAAYVAAVLYLWGERSIWDRYIPIEALVGWGCHWDWWVGCLGTWQVAALCRWHVRSLWGWGCSCSWEVTMEGCYCNVTYIEFNVDLTLWAWAYIFSE